MHAPTGSEQLWVDVSLRADRLWSWRVWWGNVQVQTGVSRLRVVAEFRGWLAWRRWVVWAVSSDDSQ